ncbi:M13 family metallopeptidase [Moellerella wisconsensis]|uniref:M13 family metallopeptidase n=1 Tax=Moellerella wisconsensis TaxID=158849 RepID=UPI0025AFEE09|nr:M13 family metallopeptidase [Moellerella wisconsensis]WJW80600.1 M13 family metallopeptidase [Moellerella wisconsensis]
MKKTLLALAISISAIATMPSAYTKDITYGSQTIVLSDNIAPGDDFYHYVNQQWIDQAKIPTGMSRINSFVELHLKTEKQLQSLIDNLLNQPENTLNHNQRNIRNLYLSYLDESAIKQAGLTPAQPLLNAIQQANSHADIAKLMAQPGFFSLISYWVDLDAKAPDTYVLYLGQGGLGLPNRSYYLDDSPQMVEIRKNYIEYIVTLLKLAGEDSASANQKAHKVLALETALAKAHWTPEANRDTIKQYHPMSLAEVTKYTAGYPLNELFDYWKLSDKQLKKIIVQNDSAVQQSAKIFADTDINTLKDYLQFHLLSSNANYLTPDFDSARFNFYSRQLNGIKQQRSRQERALETVNRLQDEPLGQLYVERYFNADSKAKIIDLVSYVKQTFRDRLQKNSWMDEQTRQEALIKLDQFKVKVGYPDQWNDTRQLTLSDDQLFDNYQNILNWSYQQDMNKVGEKVRAWEWAMPPQMINAYFNPVQNEIVFPAAILQAPFFDPNVDPAYNYGAIGAVIGHEMGHGFDDQGRLYDGKGTLRDWWTEQSQTQFNAKTTDLIKQYSNFKVNDLAVNGQLTLGENIGDLGGLSIALNAYKQFVKEHYPNGEPPIIDGTTGLQRFFISWARTWQELANQESERNKILTDPHSPNQFRGNGVVRNIDEWYSAFDVKPDNQLYLPPTERVHIW